jgi:PadR family transcriptional regulator, regulatory protein AphA
MSRCTVPATKNGPTRSRTTTSYAVLGLLAVRNWTTYELAKQVQRSLNWFWPRAERKLYDEPKQLVADGLATARKQFTGQRPGTVYEITDEGRAALRRWLDAPSAPRTSEFEAMLKVFFADAGSLDQLVATVDAIEASTVDRLRDLIGMTEAAVAGDTGFPERQHISALAIRLQFLQEEAVLTWARWARRQIAQWRSTTDPGAWDETAVLAGVAAEARRMLDSA